MKNKIWFLGLFLLLTSCAASTGSKYAAKKDTKPGMEELKKELGEAFKAIEEKAPEKLAEVREEKKEPEKAPEKEEAKKEKLVKEKNILFDFKDADIKNVVKFMARLSNLIPIMDEKIKGKLTIKTPEQLTLPEAYAVLMAVLENKGLTVIKTDKFLKVVQKKDAPQKPVETFFGADSKDVPEEDRVITQIIPVKYAKTSTILSGVKPLISKTGHVFENKETNFVIITDVASNIKRLLQIIKHLDVPLTSKAAGKTQVYRVKYLKAKEMADALGRVFKSTGGSSGESQEGVTIIPVESTNALLVTASPNKHIQVKNTLERLDVRRMQVLIEVKIIEATFSDGVSFGYRLQTLLNERSPVMVMEVGKRLADPFIFFTAVHSKFTAAMDILAKHNMINILSTPRLLTSDNQKAQIIVGREQPILKSVTNLSNSGSSNNTVSDYTYKDIGIAMEITPSINVDRDVALDISFKVTNILAQESFPGGVSVPVIGKREAKTSVTVMDNNTLILGGLIRTTTRDERQKVPLLGDIPVLGWLFSHVEKLEEKTELLVFITPHVVGNSEEGNLITEKEKGTMSEGMRELDEK